ncbi:substrate-binding domain-containing protein [Arthrobacter sp. H5]|uniref:substrate-binding domain-containing protein n=1 Tax=Arthrobacter sp. H5 TaxID=1267973 RepID=UPI0004AD9C3E|nr:substrate-binding domain-containing protein [Arthrobacter sp. H5]
MTDDGGEAGGIRRRAAMKVVRRHGVGIRELASELELSVSTVSRAMNARPDVSVATIKRVREAAARVGYTPNQTGRALRRGDTRAIALVMPTTTARTQVGETFFLTLANGLQEVLSRAGRDLIILPYGASEDPNGYLFAAADRGLADAFIVAGTQPVDPRIDYLLARGIPLVALGRTASGNHPWLDLDFDAVAADAVSRLVLRGHRRIALEITEGGRSNAVLMAEGYRRALEAEGIPIDQDLIIEVPDTRDGGYELGTRLDALSHRPTAVFLLEETTAIGLYRYLEEHGRLPGRDLAVIGLRENPVLDLLSPRLTCFRLSVEDYGRRLGEKVLRQLDPGVVSSEDGASLQELWRMDLLPGESDGPA